MTLVHGAGNGKERHRSTLSDRVTQCRYRRRMNDTAGVNSFGKTAPIFRTDIKVCHDLLSSWDIACLFALTCQLTDRNAWSHDALCWWCSTVVARAVSHNFIPWPLRNFPSLCSVHHNSAITWSSLRGKPPSHAERCLSCSSLTKVVESHAQG